MAARAGAGLLAARRDARHARFGAAPRAGHGGADDREFAAGCDTLVHLVGVAHPSPAKKAQFRSIDLASAREAISVAVAGGVRHLVYVSVAHPAPVMHAYIAVRKQGEALIAATGIPATILRPWYVLGPGHYWPYLLVPLYALGRLLPATREQALRLGLVTRAQMVRALAAAVETPPAAGMRIVDVPAIRQAQLRS